MYLEHDEKFVPVFPVYDERRVKYYPVELAYATTIHKSQGQTLLQVGLLPPDYPMQAGAAYVAISRVKDFNQIHLLKDLQPFHFGYVET